MFFIFFLHPATTELSSLSLHDALPISRDPEFNLEFDDKRLDTSIIVKRDDDYINHILKEIAMFWKRIEWLNNNPGARDRKSTRLNSSHVSISYAVFCLKKKKNK